MIVVTMTGGLGNQLFQYAFGRYLAQKHNTELKLDVTKYESEKDSHHNNYKLDKFKIQENFATSEEIKNLRHIVEKMLNNVPGVFDLEIFNAPNNVFLEGCWQSEFYFIEIENIIRQEFSLKNPLSKNSSVWKKKIIDSNCSVSIHVRHGDYLTYFSRNWRGLLTVSYYQTCIKMLQKFFSDVNVFVFSDDMQWCKNNLKLGVPMEFVEGCEYAFEEMHLMSLCDHNIVANSSFSWWGAWLNQNPDKKVFVPYPWHICGWGGETIFSDDWIKIPVDYFSSTPPMLSIIVYIENDSPVVEFSIDSILKQNFKDYEVILVDPSSDIDDEEILQYNIEQVSVKVLTVTHIANKFEAWNKGLDISRGDYVLFLTTNEFILPDTTNILRFVADKTLESKAITRDNYVTFDTFDNYMLDIICDTQILEENDNGLINITGISNKNFDIKTDALSKKLTDNVEWNLSAEERLASLANEDINALVGTKFFKREFLKKNNLRFKEEKGTDADITFIVETFWKAEKINFFLDIFYGRIK